MTKDEIINRMEALGLTRQTLAEATGYRYEYVRDRLTPNAPEPSPKFIAAVERAFSEEERRRDVNLTKPGASVWDLVFFSGREMDQIDRAKKSGGYKDLPAFYRDAVIDFADRLLAEEATPPPITFPRAHIQAAAGSPIGAEVTDWDGKDDTILVRINGLSMVPLLDDGQIITMRLKKSARSPYMKKGLVYLVEYDGGYTVKRYNKRPAKEEELGEDWVENGKVKILQSDNPEYPEMIIKSDIDWIAWLD